MHKTILKTCPECGEEFYRAEYCGQPHLCKTKLPFYNMPEIHHVRTEVKFLHKLTQVPNQNHAWNVGYDLSSVEDYIVPANGTANVPTGIAMSVPLGFFYTIEARSSLAIKGIFPIGGIIDATYTGQIFVMLINATNEPYNIKIGDRIAQAIFHRALLADITKMEEFSPEYDIRGTRGFGSSGR